MSTVLEDCRQLSSGTIGTLTGASYYEEVDEIVQGLYWDDVGHVGCCLGCLVYDSDPHPLVEQLLGIERLFGHWLEAVFEGLPAEDCAKWVIDSAKAIPVGADLSGCHQHLGVWIPAESGLLTFTDGNRKAIERVRRLHERAVAGDMPTENEWSSAATTAWSAATTAWSASELESDELAEASSSASSASAWQAIAAKSLEIFAAAPVIDSAFQINPDVVSELISRDLYTV